MTMTRPDPTEFEGRRVLVTAGTKGAGKATVRRFLAGGARVVTAARSAPDGPDGSEFVQADLTTPEGCATLAEQPSNASEASTSWFMWWAARPHRPEVSQP